MIIKNNSNNINNNDNINDNDSNNYNSNKINKNKTMVNVIIITVCLKLNTPGLLHSVCFTNFHMYNDIKRNNVRAHATKKE